MVSKERIKGDHAASVTVIKDILPIRLSQSIGIMVLRAGTVVSGIVHLKYFIFLEVSWFLVLNLGDIDLP